MNFRLIFRITFTLWVGALVLVVAVSVIAPLLPHTGQLGFSTESTFYVLDVARGVRHPLLRTNVTGPQWSPDGAELVYVKQGSSGIGSSAIFDQVILSRIFEGMPRTIFKQAVSGAFVAHRPTWLPEASQIAFTYGRMDAPDYLELVVMEPGDEQPLVEDVSGSIPADATLRWIEADRLRYVLAEAGTVRLNEMRLGEFEPVPVREWPFETVQARQGIMSSDGERFILPAVVPTSLNYELYLFDARTGQVQNISSRPVHNDSQPVWSADEQQVIFRSSNDAGQFLVLAAADGSEQTTIFHSRDGLLRDVSWSPDGRHVLFVDTRPGRNLLCIVDMQTGIANCPADSVRQAAWWPAQRG